MTPVVLEVLQEYECVTGLKITCLAQFDGIHVVSGSLDTSIRVWDVETGNCIHTLTGHQSLTSGMELKDNILVSGNADSTVKIWDIKTGQCLQTLQGPNKHQSAVTCLQFNKNFVITSSDDGTVKLWDLKTGEFIRNLVTLESGGSVVWFMADQGLQYKVSLRSWKPKWD
ncbi:F-box/WD repeat-containing protein 7-like [Microcaecilia unicolor]|uniref:F-box/WD repeat-containing protein 7-like n=1 Tax=Microcaecilia unicolor TaxID=1415580 RepID=A0A6P7X6K9_9AMPH|nr:F-box/WD repeat-containing protein 7-like [Microcaecilia unicolor]